MQALEWGASYLFKSCAMININAEADACNGCSGRGTCNAGTCQCDSSPETGFFYGPNCEFENECEEDVHCGSNGRCVDVGDTAGPANQCFCENGFFGATVASPTGLERRICDTPSALSIDETSLATFGAEYPNSRTSTGGTYEMYWQIVGDTIEVAMKAQTTSWLAVGWRSVECASCLAPLLALPRLVSRLLIVEWGSCADHCVFGVQPGQLGLSLIHI